MTSSGALLPPPILSREADSAQDLLTCSLCHELVMVDPVVTPCDHVFCRPCIVQALDYKKECPNDRHGLYICQLKPMTGMLRRIWEQVSVKCPIPGCDWTGTAGSYTHHVKKTCGKRPQLLPEGEEEYKKQIAQLQVAFKCSQIRNEKLGDRVAEAKDRIQELQEENFALRAAMDHKEAVIEQIMETQRMQILSQRKVQFDRSYSYGRERVVELTQFICKYLENKPWEVDVDRIFHCIHNMHQDLRQRYPDNPVHFHTDVRMLLHVCLASKWFSDNQLGSLMSWCQEHGWKM